MSRPAAREPGPRVIFVRCRTVAKVDSIGFVFRRLDPVLGREVVERQQLGQIFGDLRDRLRKLRPVRGLDVSSRALTTLADALRHHRIQRGTRWRGLDVGTQALLVVAHLRKGETYTDLAGGFGIGATTVFRYIREALDVLAALTLTLAQAIEVVRRKAFVILDGTLLSIDRVGMRSGRDRPNYSGEHKRHGVNVQVLADPAGRLVWASPALPVARHDMGAAREHGILDAHDAADVLVVADNGDYGAGPTVRVPQRRRRLDPDSGRYRRLSHSQKLASAAHARQRGPGERANAQLKSWKILSRGLRKIRCCPHRATTLINAVLVLILAS